MLSLNNLGGRPMLADFDVCRCHLDVRFSVTYNESNLMKFYRKICITPLHGCMDMLGTNASNAQERNRVRSS